MILFLIFAFLVVWILQFLSRRQDLDDLEVSLSTDRCLVDQGEVFDLVLRLENHSRHFLPFLRISLRLPEGMVTTLKGRQSHLQLLDREEVSLSTWMGPRQQANIRIPLTCQRRGIFTVSRLVLHRGDFLGIHEDYHSYDLFAQILAAPRPAPDTEDARVPGSFPGDLSVRRFLFEDPIFTIGCGEYTGREPMRSISWNATARTGQMMVKQYDHTMEASVTVVMNIVSRDNTSRDTIENIYSLTRTVCRQLEDRGVRYRVCTNAAVYGSFSFRQQVAEGCGEAHFRSLLEGLARCSSSANRRPDQVMEEAARDSFHTAGILLITPFPSPELMADANRVAARHAAALHVITGEILS